MVICVAVLLLENARWDPKYWVIHLEEKKILFHVSIHYICIITPLLRKNVSILWDLFYHDVRHAVIAL